MKEQENVSNGIAIDDDDFKFVEEDEDNHCNDNQKEDLNADSMNCNLNKDINSPFYKCDEVQDDAMTQSIHDVIASDQGKISIGNGVYCDEKNSDEGKFEDVYTAYEEKDSKVESEVVINDDDFQPAIEDSSPDKEGEISPKANQMVIGQTIGEETNNHLDDPNPDDKQLSSSNNLVVESPTEDSSSLVKENLIVNPNVEPVTQLQETKSQVDLLNVQDDDEFRPAERKEEIISPVEVKEDVPIVVEDNKQLEQIKQEIVDVEDIKVNKDDTGEEDLKEVNEKNLGNGDGPIKENDVLSLSLTHQMESHDFKEPEEQVKENKCLDDLTEKEGKEDLFEFQEDEEKKENVSEFTKDNEKKLQCDNNNKDENKDEDQVDSKVNQEDDLDFNFVEEETPQENKNDEENEDKPVQINLDSEGESDSDSESEEIEQKKVLKEEIVPSSLEPYEVEAESQIKKPPAFNDDDDEFDFVVEEEEEKVQQKTENKDDGFQFVEENEEAEQTNPLSQVNPPINSMNTVTYKAEVKQINLQGKNTECIASLLESFKEKHRKAKFYDTQTSIKEDDAIFQVGSEHITNSNFSYEKQNINLKRILDRIPSSKSHPEILIRSIPIEEITNVAKCSKENHTQIITDLPNSIIYKLYFKIIDLKYTYLNSIQTNFETKKSKDIVMAHTEGNCKSIHNKLADDEFVEIEEETYKPSKLEINEALLSLMDINQVENKSKEEQQKEKSEEDKETQFDETKMMEMLKTISKVSITKQEEVIESEEEKNDRELREIIASLPNYRFMVSKFVEYPDALFNL